MAEAGIAKWYAAPLPYRVLWSLGSKIRPPHFQRSGVNALYWVVCLSPFFAAIHLAFLPVTDAKSTVPRAITMLILDVLMALWFAAGVASHRRSFCLPDWDELDLSNRFD